MSQVTSSNTNDTLVFKSLTEEYIYDALKVLEKGFYPREVCCRSMKLYLDREAVDELNRMSVEMAKDGLSVIAVEKATDKVVGVALTKVMQDSDEGFFEKFSKTCRTTLAKALIEKMIEMDGACDVFKLANAHSTLEIAFIAILPEFSNNGIGGKLVGMLCDLVRKLRAGINVRKFSVSEPLDLEPVPDIATAICTSPLTLRIVQRHGFKIASVLDRKMAAYNDGPVDELPGVKVENIAVVYKTF